MLLAIFSIGSGTYAVEAARLAEVLPLVRLEPMPHGSAAVAGMANYHGTPLVVVDVHRLAGHAPAALRLSTRILLVEQGSARLGLLAAGVTGTVRLDPGALRATNDRAPLEDAPIRDAAWLGPRAVYGSGFVQLVNVESLMQTLGVAA